MSKTRWHNYLMFVVNRLLSGWNNHTQYIFLLQLNCYVNIEYSCNAQCQFCYSHFSALMYSLYVEGVLFGSYPVNGRWLCQWLFAWNMLGWHVCQPLPHSRMVWFHTYSNLVYGADLQHSPVAPIKWQNMCKLWTWCIWIYAFHTTIRITPYLHDVVMATEEHLYVPNVSPLVSRISQWQCSAKCLLQCSPYIHSYW